MQLFVGTCIVAMVFNAVPAPGVTAKDGTGADLGHPSTWFARANEQLNLRQPGAAPFQLRIRFHAFPGEEFLSPKETPRILTGDGEYDETWAGPHRWRREVRFGSYHAIEAESERGRKWTAASDYEPSRLLMLMEALLYPLPKDAGEEREPHWAANLVSKGTISLVRLSRSNGQNGLVLSNAYYFTPKGLLVMRNKLGLVTEWTDYTIFAEHLVPRHLAVSAGERQLLTADVVVSSAPDIQPSTFELPGSPAAPSQTMRPLEAFATPPRPVSDRPQWSGDDNAAISLSGVLDRTGKYRELEVVRSVGGTDLHYLLEAFRHVQYRAATLDGDPCEVGQITAIERVVHGSR